MPIHLSLAHELDAAWIIALWKAIHGGDPSPIEADVRAAELISELSDHLSRTVGHGIAPLSLQTFEARLQALGMPLSRHAGEAPQALRANHEPSGEPHEPPPYCFTFGGHTYCIHFLRRVFSVQ